jgi:hypothetical protein
MIHYDVEIIKEIIKKLKGSERRIELARIALNIGWVAYLMFRIHFMLDAIL